MGDEDHGFGAAPPDAQQLALHQPPGLGIERAERLVHQKDLGFDGVRAMAVRFMPPESCEG